MKSAEEILEGLRATMTLRDWFAGQALIATSVDFPAEGAAQLAYRYADAMIKQREKQ
jgi:hypothetical protein